MTSVGSGSSCSSNSRSSTPVALREKREKFTPLSSGVAPRGCWRPGSTARTITLCAALLGLVSVGAVSGNPLQLHSLRFQHVDHGAGQQMAVPAGAGGNQIAVDHY